MMNRRSMLGLATMTMLAAGCASLPAPTDQIAVANASLANAISAGGIELAPVEMRLAREKMERANQAMVAKDYDQARALAEQAEVDAQLAVSKTRYAKAKQAASALQEDSRVLREEINRTTQQTTPKRN
jgi:5-bromo-4-chloroindolyl phosphate hydrolysis protein